MDNTELKSLLIEATELKVLAQRNELRLLKFFEYNLAGNFITGKNGIIKECNRAFLEIYGYDNKDEVIGKNISLFYKHKSEFQDIKKRLLEEKKIKNLEGERMRKDGSTIHVLVNMVASFNSKGEMEEIHGYILDITNQRKLETDLRRAKERAEESDNLKSAFLANMSHEIRTPMNAIVGFASMLRHKNNSPEDINKYSEIIVNSSNHLLSLLNDIIDISKIEANQMKLIFSEINLDRLFLELYMYFQSQLVALSAKKIEIKTEMPQTNLIILTDENRLRQILINLIGNAIKFTKEGIIQFGYQIKKDKLLFYVKDSGLGISKKDQEIIFERFRQGNNSKEIDAGGSGLGLHIAKACANLLGGEIWVESEPGKGSEFYFTINYVPAKNKKQLKNLELTEHFEFRGEHVLIAEDDEVNFQYLSAILAPYNLKVSHTITGTETLRFINKHNDLKLILMDIRMPEMNGWEVIRFLRSKNNNIPIIVQTAYAYDSDRLESFNSGCNVFLAKPIKEAEVLSAMHNLFYNLQ